MTPKSVILVTLVALTVGAVACGDESTRPMGPRDRQLLDSWMITMPPEFSVEISYNMYDGRSFSAFRVDGNISVISANTDAPLPDFESLDDPLMFDGHEWSQIETIQSVSGTTNALYLIERFEGPPLHTAALLVGEKTTGLEWGRFKIVAIVGYDESFQDDVLDLIQSVRQVSAE